MEHEANIVLNFSKDEICEALIERLQAQNKPYPPGHAQASIKFSLSDTGATLEWVSRYETTF